MAGSGLQKNVPYFRHRWAQEIRDWFCSSLIYIHWPIRNYLRIIRFSNSISKFTFSLKEVHWLTTLNLLNDMLFVYIRSKTIYAIIKAQLNIPLQITLGDNAVTRMVVKQKIFSSSISNMTFVQKFSTFAPLCIGYLLPVAAVKSFSWCNSQKPNIEGGALISHSLFLLYWFIHSLWSEIQHFIHMYIRIWKDILAFFFIYISFCFFCVFEEGREEPFPYGKNSFQWLLCSVVEFILCASSCDVCLGLLERSSRHATFLWA